MIHFKSAPLYSPQFSAYSGGGLLCQLSCIGISKKLSITVEYFCYTPLSTFDPHPILNIHPTIFQMKPNHVHV